MGLLAFNTTAAPLAMAVTGKILPASATPGSPGPAVDVTSECRPSLVVDPINGISGGLTGANFVTIEAQRVATDIQLRWTGSPEYLTTGLTVAPGSVTPAAHAGAHATGNTDPVTVARVTRFHEALFKPAAPGAVLGTVREDTGPGTVSAQPSHPVTFDVAFAAAYTGGDITVTGVLANGAVDTEVYVVNAGATVPGTKAFAKLTSFVNATPAGTADLATVQTGALLGVAEGGTVGSFYKLSVDGADEAVAASVLANGTFTPTTAPNAVRNYEIWYTKTLTQTVS